MTISFCHMNCTDRTLRYGHSYRYLEVVVANLPLPKREQELFATLALSTQVMPV